MKAAKPATKEAKPEMKSDAKAMADKTEMADKKAAAKAEMAAKKAAAKADMADKKAAAKAAKAAKADPKMVKDDMKVAPAK